MRWSMIAVALLSFQLAFGQKPSTFKGGESLTFTISYKLFGVWVGAGEVTFSTELTEHFSKPAYHFVGEGRTFKQYDWFFKVRDRYESWASAEGLRSMHFKRNVKEGGNTYSEETIFDFQAGRALNFFSSQKTGLQTDTIPVDPQVRDILTMIYLARELDFEHKSIGEKIPIKFIIDGEVVSSYIRYLGKRMISHDLLGEIETIVFSPYLIDGTIFKGGEHMEVFVTADKNHIPVYIESEILIGRIRSYLTSYEGLKYPLGVD